MFKERELLMRISAKNESSTSWREIASKRDWARAVGKNHKIVSKSDKLSRGGGAQILSGKLFEFDLRLSQ